MIQFNLLPEIKLKYIKARKARRNVSLIALLITGISGGLFTLMFLSANVFQPIHMDNLNEDIGQYTQELQSVKDLDKVLTVQNQLNSVNGLHDQKPVASRLFGFVSQLTPTQVSISELKIDLVASTLEISGSADSLASVNKFVDTLKFTEYQVEGGEPTKAFSEVVLKNFTRTSKEATYTITLKYDLKIFESSDDITLIVPNTTTTRSTTEKPSDLFKPTQSESEQQ